MVSILNDLQSHIKGLSTDDKPMGLHNGSDYYELDTGYTYYYDAEGRQWVCAEAESNEG